MAAPSVRLEGLVAAIAGGLTALVIGLTPAQVRADEVHLPRVGQQFLAVGLALQPGFLYDDSPPEGREFHDVAPTAAGMSRVAFHQILTEQFMMSAEADLGCQWFNDHTAHVDGRAASELAFGWQLGLYGRWLPAGEREGWAVGGGPHLFQAHLSGDPLQSLGLGLKAGRYLWQSTEEFVLVEFGYSVPFIQGLLRDNDIVREDTSTVPKNWTFHRFSISVQYGF